MDKIIDLLKKHYKNKYLIAIVLFVLWLTFFDQNNFIVHGKLNREIKHLENNVVFYREQIEDKKRKLDELGTDKENLEKFAREEYLMKKENEDIFLIKEE